jgi:hypothetical protein
MRADPLNQNGTGRSPVPLCANYEASPAGRPFAAPRFERRDDVVGY